MIQIQCLKNSSEENESRFYLSIRLSIFCSVYPTQGHREPGVNPKGARGTRWTHHRSQSHTQFRDQPIIHPLRPVEETEENPEETSEARGEHRNFTHKGWRQDSNPQTQRCEINLLIIPDNNFGYI